VHLDVFEENMREKTSLYRRWVDRKGNSERLAVLGKRGGSCF
jgi:hypothetical protein